MSNIRYNEEQEAYELPYKLWNETMTVRFYAEGESAIMSELPRIAEILETINGSRKKLASLIADNGRYEGAAQTLAKQLVMKSIYLDIDEDEIVACFTLSSADGYMKDISLELYEGEFEIISEANY